jgi:hypothetical protein
MAAVAVVSLDGALFVEQHRSSRHEAELRKQLVIAKALPSAHTRMRTLLGDMGIVILREASSAEVLRVTGGYPRRSGGYAVSVTGEILGEPFVRGLADVLLDAGNYVYIDADDLSDPVSGVRLWRGRESLDILFSSEAGHTDVWAHLRNEQGDVVYEAPSYVCFTNDALERLVRGSLMKSP